jgi:hypothetical protein
MEESQYITSFKEEPYNAEEEFKKLTINEK